MSPLRKRDSFTICVPIPGFIPRQLGLDVLHDHASVISLNPLVTGHQTISPPAESTADELSWQWYEITEKIQLIPGAGKLGSGTFSFNGCFKNADWGLMTHVYAPMNINMRAKYRVGGVGDYAIEGDGPEPEEMRLTDSLYLKADIEVECNFAMVSFVRSQSKTAIGDMVERMVKKAERLDSDVLQKMIQQDNIQRAKTMKLKQASQQQQQQSSMLYRPTNIPPQSANSFIAELPATSPQKPLSVYRPYSLAASITEPQRKPESPAAYLAYNPHVNAVKTYSPASPQRVEPLFAKVEQVEGDYRPPRSEWYRQDYLRPDPTYNGGDLDAKGLPRAFSFEIGSEQRPLR